MRASVVIRARDEAASIAGVLERLAGQTEPHEVIVVDSGSSDGTPELAEAAGAHVVRIERFTFGGALNAGASLSTGEVIVSLSAHGFPPDEEWLERMTARFDDPAVACAFGESRDAGGRPLAAPVRQDAAMLRAAPHWGYSNGAGGFRADLWRERGFREDMPGTEDREWSLWAMEARAKVCLLDPALVVEHDHSRDSLRRCFARYEREARGFGMFLALPRYGARDAAREWWTDQGWHRSRARARLDPRRAARLAGKWWGRR
jgi:rhamnosyltransferase